MSGAVIVGIDPGVTSLGWAIALDTPERWRLVEAGASSAPRGTTPAEAARIHAAAVRDAARYWADGRGLLVAIEAMEHHASRGGSVAADLLSLATIGGFVAAAINPARAPLLLPPSTWKGGVPKEIHHSRILAALVPSEAAITQKTLAATSARSKKEVLDAIGIALFAAGRIARGGGKRERE